MHNVLMIMLLFISDAFSDVNQKNVLDLINIDIPSELVEMTQLQLDQNYTEGVQPEIAFINEELTATLSFSAKQRIQNSQLFELLKVMENQFNKIHPDIKWVNKGSRNINSKEYIEFEFITQTSKKDVYTLVLMTEVKGLLLISTFNCIVEQRHKWESSIKKSLQTIRLHS